MNSEYRVRIKWKELYSYNTEIRNSGFPEELRERAKGDMKGCMSDDDSCLLYSLVRYFKPIYCLETGTGRGKASAFILKAFKDSNLVSTLVSIERKTANVGELIPDDLKSRFEPINSTVEDFVASENFKHVHLDLFLHDSTHRFTHQMWEFNTFWKLLRCNGVLCSHDIAYNTSFLEFLQSKYVMDKKGLTDFEKSKFGVWGAMGNFGFITKR